MDLGTILKGGRCRFSGKAGRVQTQPVPLVIDQHETMRVVQTQAFGRELASDHGLCGPFFAIDVRNTAASAFPTFSTITPVLPPNDQRHSKTPRGRHFWEQELRLDAQDQ